MDNPALISQTGNSVSVAWIFSCQTANSSGRCCGRWTEVSDSKMFGIRRRLQLENQRCDELGIMAYAMVA